ncbi:unnamed protein product [marine sediment metagenome]|uniref:Uncharacterized protein n=1 Tax=marine sediment metagenome TaxID=412755 RepID=X0UIR8_9ZZZZ
MIVYHWTSKECAASILKYGLHKGSFVCKKEDDWHGEVCLEIDLPYDIDWDIRDQHATWQAVVFHHVYPLQIHIVAVKQV